MAYTFSSGMVVYNDLEIYQVQDISIDVAFQEIPMPSNMQFSPAIAKGQGSVKGTIKSGNFDPEFVKTITNAVMAPNASEVALVWYIADTTGTKHTVTLPNVTLTGLKFGAGSGNWSASDISFEAAAAASGGAVLTKGTAVSFPTITPATQHWIFGAGTLVHGANTVGTLSQIDCDISYQSIPLQGAKTFPVAIARGPGSVKLTAKAGELDPLFFPSITNELMAPNSGETALVWEVTDGTVTYTITYPNVTFTGRKLGSGSDKWATTDLTFSAAASTVDDNVMEVTSA